jgi:hypothetical protein
MLVIISTWHIKLNGHPPAAKNNRQSQSESSSLYPMHLFLESENYQGLTMVVLIRSSFFGTKL